MIPDRTSLRFGEQRIEKPKNMAEASTRHTPKPNEFVIPDDEGYAMTEDQDL